MPDYETELSGSVHIAADPVVQYMNSAEMKKSIERLRAQMLDAAKKMDFLEAARLRDEMIKLEDLMQIRHKEEETAQQ